MADNRSVTLLASAARTATVATGFAEFLGTDPADIFVMNVASEGLFSDRALSGTGPFTWAAGDKLYLGGSYEAATS